MYEETVKFLAKNMALGAISVHETNRLDIGKDTNNQTKYIEVLKSLLLPQIWEWYSEQF